MKTIAMIPVRMGSTRLKKKNYLKLNGVPIYERIVRLAKETCCFDEIIINSEDEGLEYVAKKLNVKFYKRDSYLASSSATADEVMADMVKFLMSKGEVDFNIFWLNTASPLTTSQDVKECVRVFNNSKAESIVTCRQSRGHIIFDGKPLNFEYDGGFARTQDMKNAMEFTYAVMGWKSSFFSKLESGTLFDDNTVKIESSFWSSILMKKEDDFKIIEKLVNII